VVAIGSTIASDAKLTKQLETNEALGLGGEGWTGAPFASRAGA
jgi:hypothetical protein